MKVRDPVLIIAVMFGWLLWTLFAGLAHAHDPMRPDLDEWMKGLKPSGGGSTCCHAHEARRVEDGDWKTENNRFRVRLEGQWIDVPPGAVVNDKNVLGVALVWATTNGPRPSIRCFLPGTWS